MELLNDNLKFEILEYLTIDDWSKLVKSNTDIMMVYSANEMKRRLQHIIEIAYEYEHGDDDDKKNEPNYFIDGLINYIYNDHRMRDHIIKIESLKRGDYQDLLHEI